MEAGAYAIQAAHEGSLEYTAAIVKLLTVGSIIADQASRVTDWATLAEDIEFIVETIEEVGPDSLTIEALDLCFVLSDLADQGKSESPENYIAEKNRELSARLTERRRRADMDHFDRRLGLVRNIVSSGGYGFVSSKEGHYFFHASSLRDQRAFDDLRVGARLVFTPGKSVPGKNPQAVDVFRVPQAS